MITVDLSALSDTKCRLTISDSNSTEAPEIFEISGTGDSILKGVAAKINGLPKYMVKATFRRHPSGGGGELNFRAITPSIHKP